MKEHRRARRLRKMPRWCRSDCCLPVVLATMPRQVSPRRSARTRLKSTPPRELCDTQYVDYPSVLRPVSSLTRRTHNGYDRARHRCGGPPMFPADLSPNHRGHRPDGRNLLAAERIGDRASLAGSVARRIDEHEDRIRQGYLRLPACHRPRSRRPTRRARQGPGVPGPDHQRWRVERPVPS